MRMLIHGLLAVLAAGALAACSPGGTGSPGVSESPNPSASSPAGTETTAPDAETTEHAPPPTAGSSLGPGPGQGNAELSILVKPSETAADLSYTLVCQG